MVLFRAAFVCKAGQDNIFWPPLHEIGDLAQLARLRRLYLGAIVGEIHGWKLFSREVAAKEGSSFLSFCQRNPVFGLSFTPVVFLSFLCGSREEWSARQ